MDNELQSKLTLKEEIKQIKAPNGSIKGGAQLNTDKNNIKFLVKGLGDENGLVSYWNFNEGTGTTLTDQTSNDNDGTINGAPWSTDIPEYVFGCTDPYADNYDSDATFDDGSCAGYPDNGEYVLSFDGADDKVTLNNNYHFSGSDNFSLIFIKTFVKYVPKKPFPPAIKIVFPSKSS